MFMGRLLADCENIRLILQMFYVLIKGSEYILITFLGEGNEFLVSYAINRIG